MRNHEQYVAASLTRAFFSQASDEMLAISYEITSNNLLIRCTVKPNTSDNKQDEPISAGTEVAADFESLMVDVECVTLPPTIGLPDPSWLTLDKIAADKFNSLRGS